MFYCIVTLLKMIIYKILNFYYEFVPDKTFGQLISVKPPSFIQCKTSDTIFDYIEIWFTDQNSKSLQMKIKCQ